MTWSLKLFKLFGVPVYAHWSFLAMLLLFTALGNGILLLLVFGIVILHEFGHILMAKHYNIQCHGVVLLPIGGIAAINNIPPEKEFMITAAGPFVNLVLATIGFISYIVLGMSGYTLMYLDMFTVFNVILLLFNLLPIYPMDGGRITRSLFYIVMSHHDATWWAVRIGQVTALCMLGVSFFLASPMLGIIMGVMLVVSQRELGRNCAACEMPVSRESPRHDLCSSCCEEIQ